jgi:hypothetical protein
MRAKEFITEAGRKAAVTAGGQGVTISIPINITIPAGGGMPVVSAGDNGPLPPEPVFVSPLQQDLELAKQQGGKSSTVINQITDDNGAFAEPIKKKRGRPRKIPLVGAA